MSIQSEFYNKMIIFNINCPKCLDTKVLWKCTNIQHIKDNMNFNKFFGINMEDELDYFMIISCNMCSGYRFLEYSKTSNIKINGIPVFNSDTDEKDISFFTIRIPFLR